jgi:S1-C subfamily serine protease
MKIFLWALSIIYLFFLSCSSNSSKLTSVVPDGKYDSEFPARSTSSLLEQISEGVKRISSIAFYDGLIFPKENRVLERDLLSDSFINKATKSFSFNNSAAGTATIIYAKQKRVAILTCAHVVDYPDTIITYYPIETDDTTRYVETYSIKKKQRNFLVDLPQGDGFQILAIDHDLDAAVLGKEMIFPSDSKTPILNLPTGSAKDLQWGSFVYVMGWPKGQKMVTRGIVSSPQRDQRYSFLIDAPFNRGFSGGIVIAIRDGVPNLEFVGIVSSVSASFEQVLVPEAEVDVSSFDPKLPYDGEILIKNQQRIDYGITFGISVDAIRQFIENNRSPIESKGFELSGFFHKPL